MRIISGSLRGRRIASPPGRSTRPMLDRVREALFSTLGARVEDALVLDLFAGTGSLALESLSRGARFARMVERNPAAARLLRTNVASLGLEEHSEVAVADALRPLAWCSRALETDRYDLIFLDPPYEMITGPTRRLFTGALAELATQHLRPGGLTVVHAPRARLFKLDLPPGAASELREYGTSALWYIEGMGEAGAP